MTEAIHDLSRADAASERIRETPRARAQIAVRIVVDGRCTQTIFPPRSVNATPVDARYVAAKALIDVSVAFVLLLLLSPTILLIAALIRITSPGPVFFRQERIGLERRRFQITKFRTMEIGASERVAELRELVRQGKLAAIDAPAFKSEHDPRVTRLGRHLRRLSLDELPQLFDVLAGNMSLVGPRPLVPEEEELLPPIDAAIRASVKPGVTCTWQVARRAAISYAQRMEMDLEYVSNRSLVTDLTILAKTPAAVFARDGAF